MRLARLLRYLRGAMSVRACAMTEFWNTEMCLRWPRLFHNFENAAFGPDFACRLTEVKPWLESGSLFYAAVVRVRKNFVPEVESVLSILLVDGDSAHTFLDGTRRETDLLPFLPSGQVRKAAAYYSSLVLASPHHGAGLFANVRRDITKVVHNAGVTVTLAFSIGTNPRGNHHLEDSGFSIQSAKYFDRYPLYALDAPASSRRPFWQWLLSPTECAHGRVSSYRVDRLVLPGSRFPASSCIALRRPPVLARVAHTGALRNRFQVQDRRG